MPKDSTRLAILALLRERPKTFGELWDSLKHNYKHSSGLAKILGRMMKDEEIKQGHDGPKRPYYVYNKGIELFASKAFFWGAYGGRSVYDKMKVNLLDLSESDVERWKEEYKKNLGEEVWLALLYGLTINDPEERKIWYFSSFQLKVHAFYLEEIYEASTGHRRFRQDKPRKIRSIKKFRDQIRRQMGDSYRHFKYRGNMINHSKKQKKIESIIRKPIDKVTVDEWGVWRANQTQRLSDS